MIRWRAAAPTQKPHPPVYAVGDIHGRADLLDQMIALIAEDCGGEPGAQVIFLGDYIDRGLYTREVIDRLIALKADPRFRPRFLKGNHEAALLEFIERPETGTAWLSYGGAETLYSYGVKAPALSANAEALRRASEALRAALPPAHFAFISELELWIRRGDYVFVHAGLRPGRALDVQEEHDLLGIRDAFLNSRRKWPFTIVHGHTPGEAVHIDERRIGVDTGAYITGRLSAVRLDGVDVRVLST